jgi:hypothetical protein
MGINANKAQAYLLYILGVGGVVGFVLKLDLSPYAAFCVMLIGYTEKLKSDEKEDK